MRATWPTRPAQSNPMMAQMQAHMAQMANNNSMMGMGGMDAQVNSNEGRAPAAMPPHDGARDGYDSDSASVDSTDGTGWAAAQPRRALTRSAAQTSTATPTTSKLPAAFLLNLGISQQHVLPPAALKTVQPQPVQVVGGHVAAATGGTSQEKVTSVAAGPLDSAAALNDGEIPTL
ncbi:hypothetical protein T492DRAFT_836595 [Pavlovales sp. CCMP2436]|nr:hypothetical protein T492DRAFT_836595 [Pavlovales sp. CCMP2436]